MWSPFRLLYAKLDAIIAKQEQLMSKVDDLISDFDTATNAIEKELADLRLQAGQAITDDQIAKLGSLRDRLRALGADPANPVPPPPTVP